MSQSIILDNGGFQQATMIPLLPLALSHCTAAYSHILSIPQRQGGSIMEPTILVIEDEQNLVEMLRMQLERAKYQVLTAYDGVQGLQVFLRHHPDLVLLDLMMPRMNGWETCRRIRELSDVPIILLTALAGDLNIVRGLENGADDYVAKPFSSAELLARVRASLRRYRRQFTSDVLVRIDDFLSVDRAAVDLSPTEFKLLTCFLDNAGRVLTHQSLLTQVWGWEYVEQTDYLKVYIHNIRKKIEKDAKRPSYILTERGLGYRFEMPRRH
jgi:two-component system KDP operon response regulator KdpE